RPSRTRAAPGSCNPPPRRPRRVRARRLRSSESRKSAAARPSRPRHRWGLRRGWEPRRAVRRWARRSKRKAARAPSPRRPAEPGNRVRGARHRPGTTGLRNASKSDWHELFITIEYFGSTGVPAGRQDTIFLDTPGGGSYSKPPLQKAFFSRFSLRLKGGDTA